VARDTRADALRAWNGVAAALAQSDKGEDRDLARQAVEFVNTMPVGREGATLAQRSRHAGAGAGALDAVRLSCVANFMHRTVRKGLLSVGERQQMIVRMERP